MVVYVHTKAPKKKAKESKEPLPAETFEDEVEVIGGRREVTFIDDVHRCIAHSLASSGPGLSDEDRAGLSKLGVTLALSFCFTGHIQSGSKVFNVWSQVRPEIQRVLANALARCDEMANADEAEILDSMMECVGPSQGDPAVAAQEDEVEQLAAQNPETPKKISTYIGENGCNLERQLAENIYYAMLREMLMRMRMRMRMLMLMLKLCYAIQANAQPTALPRLPRLSLLHLSLSECGM